VAAIAKAYSEITQKPVELGMESVSFIIPHKGREGMLIETIRSIAALDYPHEQLEIVLVSQNPSVSADIRRAAGTINLQVIESSPNNTISTSRNIGAKRAQGSYFAFLDADIALSANWLNTCLKLLQNRPATKLVSAMQLPSDMPTPLEHIRVALSNADVDCTVSFLPGRNLLLSKDTFYQAGQFPDDLVTCEDYYFTDKVNQLGELYYTSEAQYVHIGEDKQLGAMFSKEIWRGQSNLASTRDRHIPLREWPSFIVPVAIPGLLLCALLLALTGYSGLSLLALVLSVLPVLAYSVRLFRLVAGKTSFWQVLKFYSVYFPARAIGTVGGIIKTIGTSSHGK
jgi:GT2 family glycosyltransferase